MEMYMALLKRVVLLTDEYLKLYDEVKELKKELKDEKKKKCRIVPMKIEKKKSDS
jgi:hypothetical protein